MSGDDEEKGLQELATLLRLMPRGQRLAVFVKAVTEVFSPPLTALAVFHALGDDFGVSGVADAMEAAARLRTALRAIGQSRTATADVTLDAIQGAIAKAGKAGGE